MGNINNWKKFNESITDIYVGGRGRNLRNPVDKQNKYIVSIDSFNNFNFDENKFGGEFMDQLNSITSSLSNDGYRLEAIRGRYPLPENDTVEYGLCLKIDVNSFKKFIDWDILKDVLLDIEDLSEENGFKVHVGITWGQDMLPVENYISLGDFIQRNPTITDLRKIEIIFY